MFQLRGLLCDCLSLLDYGCRLISQTVDEGLALLGKLDEIDECREDTTSAVGIWEVEVLRAEIVDFRGIREALT